MSEGYIIPDMTNCNDTLKMISILYRKMQIILNEQNKDIDVTSGLVPFLFEVKDGEPLTQNDIAARLDIGKSTVAKSVAKLEEMGYLIRSGNEDDGRSIIVTLSEKGRQVIPELEKGGYGTYERMFGCLTDIERTLFIALLEKITANLA